MHKRSILLINFFTLQVSKTTLLGFLTLLFLPLSAQELPLVSSAISSWDNQNNGFLSNKVSAVERDPFGRLWIGTYGKGLIVRTSASTIHYQNAPFNPHSLASNTINDILVLPEQQTVVLATNMGLSLFDPNQDHFINYQPGGLVIDNQEVNARNTYRLLYDSESQLVWGSSYSVVFSFDPETGTLCEYPATWEVNDDDYSKVPINIYDIAQDDQYIYFCDLERIWSLNKVTKEITRIANPGDQHKEQTFIKGLIVNADKKTGYILKDTVIWMINLPLGNPIKMLDIPKWINPRELIDIDKKQLLISGRSGAILLSKGSNKLGEPFRITFGGQDVQVKDFARDSILGITFGTRNHGLLTVAPYHAYTRKLDNGSPSLEKNLTGVFTPSFSEENRYWLAQESEIQHIQIDSSKVTALFSIQLPKQLKNNINTLLDLGSFLIVGSTEGLFEYHKRDQSFRKVPIELDYDYGHMQITNNKNFNIYSLARQGQKLFVGGPRVFQLLAGPEQLGTPTELPDRFAVNVKGKLEVVEEEQLLWKIDYGAPAALDLQNGVVYELDTIFPFSEPGKSHNFYFDGTDLAWDNKRKWLWAVGSGYGLFAFKVDRRNKIINLVWSVPAMQGTNLFDAITVDDAGRIWVGSDEGLILYDPETNESSLLGRMEGKEFPLFRKGGLINTSNGQIIAQTLNGCFTFWQDSLANVLSRKHVPINLDNYEIASKDGSILKQSRFPPGSLSYLELPGSATILKMNFSFPVGVPSCFGNELYYRLKGFQESFVKWDINAPVVLSDLPPGDYRFQIFAQDQSFPIFDTALYKYPAWYQRKVTYFLLALLFGVLVVFVVRLRVASLERRNKALQLIVTERTEKLRLEKDQVARQASELKRLNQQQEQLLVNVIHEFRTPLSMVSAPLQSIKSYFKSEDHHKTQQRFLGIAERGIKELDVLLKSLRHLLKEPTALELAISPFEPASFFEEKAAAFRMLADRKGINFHQQFCFINKEEYFETDVQKISIILNNLLSNALKYTPPGHAITLFVSLSASDELSLIVTDEGPGIPELIKDKIFERFFQAEQASKSGGLGVGLSIAKVYTELLKGKISVYSAPGKGAQFEVTLPLKRCPASKKASAMQGVAAIEPLYASPVFIEQSTDVQDNTKRKTIAIVEDHQGMQQLFSTYLSEWYEIQTYAEGQVFFNTFEKEAAPTPDLIITDLMMPGVSGFEVIKWINTSPIFADLPVMVVSAVDHYGARQSVIELGVYDFLPKPFFPEELIVKVQRLFRLEGTRSRARKLLRFEEGLQHNKHPRGLRKKVESIIQPKLNDDDLSVEDIARQVYLSKRHLNRLLKAECGMSVKEVLIEMRLQEAYRILQTEPGIVIKDVAFRIGYNKPSYFSKIFRQRFGISPREVMRYESKR